MELPTPEHPSGVAATSEGFVALGYKGNTLGPPLVRRYSASLVALGDHNLSPALSNKPAELTAGATLGGATVFVGTFRPAMPQSASTVMLLGRAHFPPKP